MSEKISELKMTDNVYNKLDAERWARGIPRFENVKPKFSFLNVKDLVLYNAEALEKCDEEGEINISEVFGINN